MRAQHGWTSKARRSRRQFPYRRLRGIEATSGQCVQTNNQEELVEAFQKTLGYPMMSRLAPSGALRFGPKQMRHVADCSDELLVNSNSDS